jgi:hypothetical protein
VAASPSQIRRFQSPIFIGLDDAVAAALEMLEHGFSLYCADPFVAFGLLADPATHEAHVDREEDGAAHKAEGMSTCSCFVLGVSSLCRSPVGVGSRTSGIRNIFRLMRPLIDRFADHHGSSPRQGKRRVAQLRFR